MDKSEAQLFQHISIVIKLLNCFSHKRNITSSDVLHRLDYLYERLSDFLGRELNEWWLNNDQEDSLFSQHFIPQITNLLKPGSSNLQPSEFVEITKPISLTFNPETSQNDDIENAISEVTHNSASSCKEEGAVIPAVQESDVSDVDYADAKLPNCMEPTENVTESELLTSQVSNKTTEALSPVLHCSDDESTVFKYKCEDCNEEIISFNPDKQILMSLHIQSAEHRKALKQEIKTSSVSIKAKINVPEVSDIDYADGKLPICMEPTEDVTESEHSTSSKTTEALSLELHCSDDESTVFKDKCEDCNEEISSFNPDKQMVMALHIQSTEHQKNLKQDTKMSSVSINEKRNVTMKSRNDLGRYVIEKVTTIYFCDVCNVNNIDDVRDHVFNINHQANMREKKGIAVSGTKKTESIAKKVCIIYTVQYVQ
ncbi:hypothetical protein L9F63_004235 [Diploptera punctata]|uniref:Uncharacterized protein n=1 Tax=Diploptera punctata TaxID=6984 RepID=A0AAD8E7K0_DIPPU|nr:hypothetical protein L9F63_004235 [Diploptera punctata]